MRQDIKNTILAIRANMQIERLSADKLREMYKWAGNYNPSDILNVLHDADIIDFEKSELYSLIHNYDYAHIIREHIEYEIYRWLSNTLLDIEVSTVWIFDSYPHSAVYCAGSCAGTL